MSTGTGGELTIVPALVFGTVGAAAVAAVGGVVVAVNAYVEARNRIKRELDAARIQQSQKLGLELENWKVRLQAAYRVPESAAAQPKSTEDFIAETTPRHVPSSGLKDGALLAALRENERVVTEADQPLTADPNSEYQAVALQELLSNVANLVAKIDFTLPREMETSLARLYQEVDVDKASVMAREIRLKVSSERQRMEEERLKEMQDACSMLDALPSGYPAEARAVLAEAAEGRIGFDTATKKAALEMIAGINAAAAAQVLRNSLTDLGYDIGTVENSLFAEGGEFYLRKGEWEDGYCVKMRVKDDKFKFFMQKTVETSAEYDRDMKKQWCEADLPQMKARLCSSGFDLVEKEIEGHTIQGVKTINIPTSKKRSMVKDEAITPSATSAEQEKCI